jgi:aryl-alcohol dehydrogenase-like predicted oxidoreductase
MTYRSFGTTDLRVSPIGLGCQSLGGGIYRRDDQESLRILRRALDGGINFFDVSDHHSLGVSERLLGQAFKGRRREVLVTSKAGFHYTPLATAALRVRFALKPVSHLLRPLKRALHYFRARQGRYDFSEPHLMASVEASLRRLQTDYIDLFQLYKPAAPLLERGDFLPTLEKLKRQGKIRYYGIACQTVEEGLAALRLPGIVSVQVAVNLLEQEAVTQLIPLAQQRGIAVIARHPRAIGLLTDAGDDLMGDSSAYAPDVFAERVERAKAFRFLIRKDRTMAQAAIQFVLQLPGIAIVIPRAVTLKDIEENLGALTAPSLSQEELRQVASV